MTFGSTLGAQALPPAGVEICGPYLPQRFDGQMVVRASLKTPRDARVMLALSGDPWTCSWSGQSPAEVEFRVSAEALGAMREAGIASVVVIPDVQAAIDAERVRVNHSMVELENLRARGGGGDGVWFTDYKDWNAINAYANDLIALRPDLVSRVPVGNSVEGRPVFALRISGPANAPGSRPGVYVEGLQHAREWITAMSAMSLADVLVRSYGTDTRITRLLDGLEFSIVPVVNPDGYEYAWATNRLWRLNRKEVSPSVYGVDTNRNWGYRWGGEGASSSPGSDTYRGPSAFSEPETSNVRAYIEARPNYAAGIDLHSYSQLVLEPWGFAGAPGINAPAHDLISQRMVAGIFGVAGQTYWSGNSYRTIYPASGTASDWFHGGAGMLGWTIELRDRGQTGFILPANQIVATAAEATAGVLAVADTLIDNPIVVNFAYQRPTRVPAGGSLALPISVHRGTVVPESTRSFKLWQRIGRTGAFTDTALANASDQYTALATGNLLGGACGSVTQYYLEVTLAGGGTALMPPGAPALPYEAVAQTFTTVFADDCELARGWTIGGTGTGDTATNGQWVRTSPVGSLTQWPSDHTIEPGLIGYFTGGNSVGVTGGQTTLRSPIFNLAGRTNIYASFWLSYNNGRGAVGSNDDPFVVDVTANASAGTPTWVRALTIAANGPAPTTTGPWVRYSVRLDGLITPTSTVRLRFIARDTGVVSTVEAGLDDFELTSATCVTPPCPGDFGGDGTKSPSDIFDYLNTYFSASLAADFDGSGTLAPADIFAFLNAYFLPCP